MEIALFSHSAKSGTLPISKNSILVKSIEKHKLTMREGEIILMISNGLRHKEISQQLFISEATVKRHLSNIYQKVGVQSSIDALNKLQEG